VPTSGRTGWSRANRFADPQWSPASTVRRVIYGLPREGTAETDVWVVPADGTGSPAVYIPYAWSPSVVREVVSLLVDGTDGS
jgi:hypothetical protein